MFTRSVVITGTVSNGSTTIVVFGALYEDDCTVIDVGDGDVVKTNVLPTGKRFVKSPAIVIEPPIPLTKETTGSSLWARYPIVVAVGAIVSATVISVVIPTSVALTIV